MSKCNVCGEPFSQPMYVGPPALSITSLCEIRPGQTIVFFCDHCGHLQTTPLPEIAAYYESQYRILLDSDDEDQLYQVQEGNKIYRIEHQVRTFLKKVPLPPGARVLDYGCAKGASAKKLLQARPDLSAHLFDVSSMYKPFWERFTTEVHWSTHETKRDWDTSFDAVMSFYVLEHVVEPVSILANMASLLKPSGVLYWLVPNVLANPADFIVADHVNHFSRRSIEAAVRRAGLRLIEIDGESHEAGWIVIAAKNPDATTPLASTPQAAHDELPVQLAELSRYWQDFEQRIQDFEHTRRDHGVSAIYGSGFYGTFIASRLADLNRIGCFVDQSPYRQGKMLLDKSIIPPERLPDNVKTVYVGLNMRSARKAIADITSWRDRPLTYFFL